MADTDTTTEILSRARMAGLHRFVELYPDALIRAGESMARHLANIPASDDLAIEPAARFTP
jgi:hypothetical protein